ncbi:hypothetical protein [Dysgonomonas macrotermitis]|uniref:Uncharacterized protein n=1 Tax=Dysgonomonas macrotermitis TaxID=1346286 RepID=A0A1M5HGX1_9BACT|nr:hypothetical protein [Dysgonomonas macrotermitis]SHG15171.1 hypothetical protein SAMN05444362_11661 [Dysgonomonas macrotermitis]
MEDILDEVFDLAGDITDGVDIIPGNGRGSSGDDDDEFKDKKDKPESKTKKSAASVVDFLVSAGLIIIGLVLAGAIGAYIYLMI